MREIKLKYLCESFAGNLALKDIPANGQYPVFGASGQVGFLNSYGTDKEYLGIIKDGAGVGRVEQYPAYSSLLGTMTYIIPKTNVAISWLKYAIMSLDLGKDVGKTTIPHIYFSDYGNRQLPYISIIQQESIVNMLNEKIDKVDVLIANQEAQIEKLKAYKQSLITEVVTKGLDKSVPMKDSGVEWIGEIPEHWSVVRVRNIGTTQNGISKGGEFFGEGFPFVSYGDVYKNYELPIVGSGLIRSTAEEQETYSVKKGDIFFTRTSETIEEVGFSSVCCNTIENATFAGFLIRLRPFNNMLNLQYAKYYFRGEQIRRYLVKEMNLVTRASLGQELLKSMNVLVPPHVEQIEIAEYLNVTCQKIDRVIAIKQQKIEKLNQYKKSLIYEYVTGKKEVV